MSVIMRSPVRSRFKAANPWVGNRPLDRLSVLKAGRAVDRLEEQDNLLVAGEGPLKRLNDADRVLARDGTEVVESKEKDSRAFRKD